MAIGAMTEAQGQRWANQRLLLVTLWLTLMILAIKVWIGWATRSLSLMAEALYTLVASFSLLLSLLMLISPVGAYRDPWGHSRLETNLALILFTVLGCVSCLLLALAAGQMGLIAGLAPATIAINAALLQLLGGVTAASLFLGLVGRYQGQRWGNPALKFSFSQSLNDAGLTALVIGGLVASMVGGITWLDPVLVGIVLLATGISGWRIVHRQLPSMMQHVAIAPEALARTTRQVEGILHCYDIQSRGLVGRLVWVELRLILHPECMDVANAIAQRVERLIMQQYGPAKVSIQVDGLPVPKR